MPAKTRKIAPYTLAAQAGQASLLDLFDEAPAQTVRREPVLSHPKKSTAPRKPAAKTDPEASLLNLLFEEPEREAPTASNAWVSTVQSAPVSVPPMNDTPDEGSGLLQEIDTLEKRLQSARARFNDPALQPIQPPVACNENMVPPAPLSHPRRQLFKPEFWLYLGALAGGGLALLFGAVFFPLTHYQGWETHTVRALFGVALGTLWGILPFLLHSRQTRNSTRLDAEAQVYTSWQTRGEIIPNCSANWPPVARP
ncbi:MAG: hypothetical protein AAF903_02375 [Pseudomonadota bacterium]